MPTTAYLNGEYLPLTEARVPVLDRGFLFGDGVYEVARVYRGVPFELDAHLRRLSRSLDELRIAGVDVAALSNVATELLRRDHLSEATIYFQITRGVAEVRTHAFPSTP